MKEKYTAKDVLEMAIDAKKRGTALYLMLAKNSNNYHVGKLFLALAKDEKNHKKALEKWLKKLKTEKFEAYPGERSLFLKALADQHTFTCDKVCKSALETTISEEEALKAGIGFEKDFLLFLHELKGNVDPKEHKAVDKLIDEEIDHLKMIFKIKDSLEK